MIDSTDLQTCCIWWFRVIIIFDQLYAYEPNKYHMEKLSYFAGVTFWNFFYNVRWYTLVFCHSISRKSNKDIIFLQSLHKCAIDCDEGLITLSDIEMHNYLHECSTVCECKCVYGRTLELDGKHVVLIVLTGT